MRNKTLGLIRKIVRRFHIVYETTSERRFLRVAKFIGIPEETIEHELSHAKKIRELGYSPTRYIAQKSPGYHVCYVGSPKNMPLDKQIQVAMAPEHPSDQDYELVRKFQMELDSVPN